MSSTSCFNQFLCIKIIYVYIHIVIDDLFGQLHLIAALLAFHCGEEMVKYKASSV